MLAWITQKLRAFTQKSTPSSAQAGKILPEQNALSLEETLEARLQIVSRVLAANPHLLPPGYKLYFTVRDK